MVCRIAIIDSAIFNNMILVDDSQISNYYICNNNIVSKMEKNSSSLHGTDVLNNILYECQDVEIISIQVLKENNKGKAIDLLRAIDFCIQKKVSFINISLGIVTENMKYIEKLKRVCQKAVERGITIISAMSNEKNISYPAVFDFVIGVSSNIKNGEYITFNENKKDIYFCSSSVFSKGNREYKINTGNSYLSGYVTGVFCAFFIKNKQKALDFFKTSEIKSQIFVNPFNEKEFNRKILLIYFEKNLFDIEVEKYIGKVKKINWSIMKEKKNLGDEIIVLGSINLPCLQQIKKEIVQWLIHMKIDLVYCIVPIFNTIERYEIAEKYCISIKTIYV